MAFVALQSVIAGASGECIVSATTTDKVIAIAPVKNVCGSAAKERVNKIGSKELFNPSVLITQRVTCVQRQFVKINQDSSQRALVARRIKAITSAKEIATGATNQNVIPRAAIDIVVAAATKDLIIAVAAIDTVGQVVAVQHIVEQRSKNVFDVYMRVADRIVTSIGNDSQQVDGDGC